MRDYISCVICLISVGSISYRRHFKYRIYLFYILAFEYSIRSYVFASRRIPSCAILLYRVYFPIARFNFTQNVFISPIHGPDAHYLHRQKRYYYFFPIFRRVCIFLFLMRYLRSQYYIFVLRRG